MFQGLVSLPKGVGFIVELAVKTYSDIYLSCEARVKTDGP